MTQPLPPTPPIQPRRSLLSSWIATSLVGATILGFIVTAVWFVVTLVCFFGSQENRDSWITTTGEVTELVPSKSDEISPMYLRYTFTAQNGNTYTVKSDVAVYPPSHQVGDKVEMLYPADNPTSAVEKGTSDNFLPIFFGAVTLFWLLVSLVLLFITRAVRKKARAQN